MTQKVWCLTFSWKNNANKFDGWPFFEKLLRKCDVSLLVEKTTQTSLMGNFFLKSDLESVMSHFSLKKQRKQVWWVTFSWKSDLESVMCHQTCLRCFFKEKWGITLFKKKLPIKLVCVVFSSKSETSHFLTNFSRKSHPSNLFALFFQLKVRHHTF